MKEPYWPQSPDTQLALMNVRSALTIAYFHVDKALDACARDENVDKYPAIGLHMQDIAIATASLAASISMLRRTLGVKETDDDGTNDR